MRPFGSMTLEPRLEQGVPWGCDLFTFVTSAAGNMMRTLQKPRKSRPSKRQVNHRRFLHNMIQRKFADIEVANHRLASALSSAKGGDKVISIHLNKPASPDQSDGPSGDVCLHNPAQGKVGDAETEVDGVSEPGPEPTLGLIETDLSEIKQPDSGLLSKQSLRSQSSAGTVKGDHPGKRTEGQKDNTGSGIHKWVDIISLSSLKSTDIYYSAEPFQSWCNSIETQPEPDNIFSGDCLYSWSGSAWGGCDSQFRHDPEAHVQRPSQRVDTSALSSSLDSHDLSTWTQENKNVKEMTESQWGDMMDLLEPDASERDFGGGCTDVEIYLENACAWQTDAEVMVGKACGHDAAVADQSKMMIHGDCDIRPEMEYLDLDGGEYGYGHGHRNRGGQGSTGIYSADGQRGSPYVLAGENGETEVEFASKSFQDVDINQNYHYEIPELTSHQCPRQESSCMLPNSEAGRNYALFGSVAQSFPAPSEYPQYPAIVTPPLENDWLFTDILQDK